jgi:hypothetical protein
MSKTYLTVGLLLLCVTAWADSPVQQNLEKMRVECDKVVAAAAKPVYLRYQSVLDQMLRKAQQANDAEAVMLIGAEAERAALLTQTKESMQSLMSGSHWEWFDTSKPGTKTETWMEFYKDGSAMTSWGNAVRWEVSAPSTLRIIEEAPPITWTMILNVSKKEATADKSAGGELRSMRYQRSGPVLNPNKK